MLNSRVTPNKRKTFFVLSLFLTFFVFSSLSLAFTLEEKQELGIITTEEKVILETNIITTIKTTEPTLTKTINKISNDVVVKNEYAEITFLEKTDINLSRVAINKKLIAVSGETNTKARITINTGIPNTILGIYKYSGITSDDREVLTKGELYTLVKTDDYGKASFRNIGFSTLTYSLPSPIYTGAESSRIKVYDLDDYISNDYDTVFITLYNDTDTLALLDASYNTGWRGGIFTSDAYITNDYEMYLSENGNNGFELMLKTRTLNMTYTNSLMFDLNAGNLSIEVLPSSLQTGIEWEIGDSGGNTSTHENAPSIATPFNEEYYLSSNNTLPYSDKIYFADMEAYFTNFTAIEIFGLDYVGLQSFTLGNITIGSNDYGVYLAREYNCYECVHFQTLGQDFEDTYDLEINNQGGTHTEPEDTMDFFIRAWNSAGYTEQSFRVIANEEGEAESSGEVNNTIIYDTAETGTFSNVWKHLSGETNGSYSTTRYYEGSKSIYFAGGTWSNASSIGSLVDVTFTAYFYDGQGSGSTAEYKNYLGIGEYATSNALILGILPPASNTHYVYQNLDSWTSCGVARSIGWHNLTLYLNTTGSYGKIDDNSCFTGATLPVNGNSNKLFIESGNNDPYFDNIFLFSGQILTYDELIETAPSQITSFATPYIINGTGILQLNLNNFFVNYTNVSITFADEVLSQNSYLATTVGGSTDIYDYDHIEVNLQPYGNSVFLNVFGENYDFSTLMNITVSNTEGQASAVINVTIVNTTAEAIPDTYPQQLASFTPIIIYYDETETYIFNNFFTNYTNISVTFADNTASQTAYLEASINGSSDNYTYAHFTAQLLPTITGINLNLFSGNEDFNTTLYLETCNEAGCINNNFTVTVREDTTPSDSIIYTFFTSIESIFPDSDDITLSQQLLYVILSMIITAVLLGVGIFSTQDELVKKLLLFCLGLLLVIEVFFFVANGYIPITVLVLIALGSSLILYSIMRKQTA